MNTNSTSPSTEGQALAANFQVAELEPRHENMWAGTVPGGNDVETATPSHPEK